MRGFFYVVLKTFCIASCVDPEKSRLGDTSSRPIHTGGSWDVFGRS